MNCWILDCSSTDGLSEYVAAMVCKNFHVLRPIQNNNAINVFKKLLTEEK